MPQNVNLGTEWAPVLTHYFTLNILIMSDAVVHIHRELVLYRAIFCEVAPAPNLHWNDQG